MIAVVITCDTVPNTVLHHCWVSSHLLTCFWPNVEMHPKFPPHETKWPAVFFFWIEIELSGIEWNWELSGIIEIEFSLQLESRFFGFHFQLFTKFYPLFEFLRDFLRKILGSLRSPSVFLVNSYFYWLIMYSSVSQNGSKRP